MMIEKHDYCDSLEEYKAERYDQIKIYVAKGARETVRALAYDKGVSVSEYIRGLIISDAKKRGIDVSAAFFTGGGYDAAIEATMAITGQDRAPWI